MERHDMSSSTFKEILNRVSTPGTTGPEAAAAPLYGKSLGYGFSTLNKTKDAITLPPGSEDHLLGIEASVNFSTVYSSAHSPEEDMLQSKLRSVIFRVSESQLKQIVTYHFWKKTYLKPLHYVITVSTQDRQVETIECVGEGSIPAKFFKITDDNYVDIVEYATPRL